MIDKPKPWTNRLLNRLSFTNETLFGAIPLFLCQLPFLVTGEGQCDITVKGNDATGMNRTICKGCYCF